MSKKLKRFLWAVAAFLVVILFILFFSYIEPNQKSQKVYSAKQLGIAEIKSKIDADNDSIDDYTDIMLGARAYIKSNPKYKSKYYDGGYPTDGYGVCTDVVWHALKTAGYHLKELVDEDIEADCDAYTTIDTPDPNIDFRRVKNLKIFFERNAESLTTNLNNPEEWQAGDIVVFEKHIAICSDKRNAEGIPFMIHHDGAGAREANDIGNYTIIGHYRWMRQR